MNNEESFYMRKTVEMFKYRLVKNGTVFFEGSQELCFKKLLEIRPLAPEWHDGKDIYKIEPTSHEEKKSGK